MRFSENDLYKLIRIRAARRRFVENLQNHASKYRAKKGLAPLPENENQRLATRYEAIAMICESFALLNVERSKRPERIRQMLTGHNELIDDRLKVASPATENLPRNRLMESKFSELQIARTIRLDSKKDVEVHQSVLCRLLSSLMSFETCRSLISLLAEAGLLTRERIGEVMVGSPGHLEKYYAQYLNDLLPDETRSESKAL